MWLSKLETRWLADRLAHIPIDRPVFVSGLARSGSTLLLELLAAVPNVTTHRYRDFPFSHLPYWWNCFLDRFPADLRTVERPHQDGIMITRESPEAMEEPLWSAWFPELHLNAGTHYLNASMERPGFEQDYRNHLRKLQLVRGGTRYVAKNNYQLPRAEYVWKLFPDAEFIVPIRHPLTHVTSLVRQHETFMDYASQEPRIDNYLRAVGHYEFGPQRVPLRLAETDSQRVLDCWAAEDNALGYAIQWNQVYMLAWQLQQSPRAGQVHVVRYEDLCDRPARVVAGLLDKVGLLPDGHSLPNLTATVSVRPHQLLNDVDGEAVWKEVGDLAEKFGYSKDQR